jgi:hypothetical protein
MMIEEVVEDILIEEVMVDMEGKIINKLLILNNS